MNKVVQKEKYKQYFKTSAAFYQWVVSIFITWPGGLEVNWNVLIGRY